MLLEKEYPATHSMSTAWYLVDEDDNVGIMEFNENGPVPAGHFGEYSVMGLARGEDFEYEPKGYQGITLTEEQTREFFSEALPLEPSSFDREIVVRIDTAKEARLHEIITPYKGWDEDKPHISCDRAFCLGEGYYELWMCDCITQETPAKFLPDTPFQALLDEQVILSVHREQEFYTDDSIVDGELKLEKEFDSSPYYIYFQPYWKDFLQHRMHVPKHPVKLSQVAPKYRDSFFRIPHKFDDLPQMQIARYICAYAYRYSGEVGVMVDHCRYDLLPDEGGGQIYYLSEPFDYDDTFFSLIPERRKDNCRWLYSARNSHTPSLLLVMSPRYMKTYETRQPFLYKQNRRMVSLSYIPYFPYEPSTHSPYSWNDQELIAQMTDDKLLDLLQRTPDYLIHIVEHIRPQVIVLDDDALAVFSQVFPIEEHMVTIGGERYPLYLLSELDTEWAVVDELAQRPYRGREVRLFYTEAEMQELLRQELAQEV